VPDIRVELLAVEGCPHLEQARLDLESALRAYIIETPIQLIIVNGPEDAEFLEFPGSPTIRIDGEDVMPEPGLEVNLGCRTYLDEQGVVRGSPPLATIQAAVDAHRRGRLREFQQQEAGLARIAREIEEDDNGRAGRGDVGTDGGAPGDREG
jgi:hypothetical protein